MRLSGKGFRNFFKSICFCALSVQTFSQNAINCSVKYYRTRADISIRALGATHETIWFAANKGVWGYKTASDTVFKLDSIKVDTIYPEFRSIAAVNDSTVFLLSVGSPAYLFKTTNGGKTWNIVYTNADKNIFFDSMIFSDSENGIALADPMDGCFHIIKTTDQGKTWRKINCSNIPAALDGEACFAASNSCIDMVGSNVWFVTGGKHARIFHSSDKGNRFKVYNTPMVHGETMTGIYALDFINDTLGIIAGGNYDKADSSYTCLAITADAGISWKKINTRAPFFGSSVKIQSRNESKTLLSQKRDTIQKPPSDNSTIYITGHSGTFKTKLLSDNLPVEILDSSGKKLKFHTCLLNNIRGNKIWLAGSNGIIATFNGQ